MPKHTDPREIIPYPAPNNKRFQNITGQTFGRLTVVKLLGRYANHPAYIWECLCSCGNRVNVCTNAVTKLGQISCGCWKSESAIKRFTTHGMKHSREYETWCRMWARCTNPK